jgi:ribosomal RNA assembly protein
VDLQIESGEYFLSKEIKEAKAIAARQEAQAAKVQERKQQREAAFTAPAVLFSLYNCTRTR